MSFTSEPVERDDADAYAPDSLLERTIQTFLSQNLHLLELGPLHLVGTEYPVQNGRIDILASSHGVLYVIEVKRGTASREAVGQLQAYVGHMMNSEPQMQVRGILVAADLDAHASAALVATPTIDFWSFAMKFTFSRREIARPVRKAVVERPAASGLNLIYDKNHPARTSERRASLGASSPSWGSSSGAFLRRCGHCGATGEGVQVRSLLKCVKCGRVL